MSVETPTIQAPTTSFTQFVSRQVVSSAFNSGYCALAAWAFSLASLPAAAVFGATESLVRNGINYLTGNKGAQSSILKTIAAYAVACPAAVAATKGIGFSLTFSAGIKLTAAILIPSLAITAICLTVFGIAAYKAYSSAAQEKSTSLQHHDQPLSSSQA